MTSGEPTQSEANGAVLRAWRQAAGITVRDLAGASQIDESHLSHYEAGRKALSPDRLERVRTAIGRRIGGIND